MTSFADKASWPDLGVYVAKTKVATHVILALLPSSLSLIYLPFLSLSPRSSRRGEPLQLMQFGAGVPLLRLLARGPPVCRNPCTSGMDGTRRWDWWWGSRSKQRGRCRWSSSSNGGESGGDGSVARQHEFDGPTRKDEKSTRPGVGGHDEAVGDLCYVPSVLGTASGGATGRGRRAPTTTPLDSMELWGRRRGKRWRGRGGEGGSGGSRIFSELGQT